MKPRWLVATIYSDYERDVHTFMTKMEALAYYKAQQTTLYEVYLAKIEKG